MRTADWTAETLIEQLASELESELRHRYGWPDVHPAMQHRFDRDMATVKEARAYVASQTEGSDR